MRNKFGITGKTWLPVSRSPHRPDPGRNGGRWWSLGGAITVWGLIAVAQPALVQAEKYESLGRPDPFQSPVEVRSSQPAQLTQPPPLAQRPPGLVGLLVSEVTVAGVASNGSRNIVILKGIDDFTYIAQQGSRLYDGFIEEVASGQVVFLKEVTDNKGARRTSKVVKQVYTESK